MIKALNILQRGHYRRCVKSTLIKGNMRNNGNMVIGALSILLFSFYGCGSESSSPSQTAPAISDLAYTPNHVIQGSGCGAVTVWRTRRRGRRHQHVRSNSHVHDSMEKLIQTSAWPIPFATGYTSRLFLATANRDTAVKAGYTCKI